MEITINYSEAEKAHPEMVKKWAKEAQTGKGLKAETLKWSYYFGVKVAGMNGMDFVRKLGSGELFEDNKKENQRTPEQVADEILGNVIMLSLRVSGVGFKREKSLTDTPSLFTEKYKAIILESERQKLEEKREFDSLSPEEQERRQNEILNELHGMGGFFGMQVGPGGVRPMAFPRPVVYDMNDILDKISKVGVAGLTAGEKKFLDDSSKK